MTAQPIDLNILPEQYRPRQFSLGRLLLLAAATAVVAGLGLVFLAWQNARADTASLQTQLDAARLTLDEAQAAQVELNSDVERVGQEIEMIEEELIRLRSELAGLGQQQLPETAVGIRAIVETEVPRVRLTSVTQLHQSFRVNGSAGSQALVLDYARAFEATGEFGNVRILGMENDDPPGTIPDVKFVILLER